MRKCFCLTAALALLAALGCSKNTVVTVNAGDYDRTDCVVRVELKKAPKAPALVETTGGQSTPVDCQVVVDGGAAWLYFTLAGDTPAGATRTFSLSEGSGASPVPRMSVADDGGDLTLKSGSKEILTYNYAVTPAPEGVRQVFARSGFIHLAKTPSGFVYTNIQPRDHRHHYGIWNPWTRVEYAGKVYDLWNLGDSLGTVRSRSIDDVYQGSVLSGFNAALDHVAFTPDGEKTIIDEEWNIRAYDAGDGFLWDFESVLKPCTDIPVTIQAYRYQGFSCRATAYWTRENCYMMTSEGLTRPEIDGSTARWIYVNGASGEDTMAGFMFMATPDNYNSPEPLRIWNEEQNGGRGDVYVNFCPTKTKDWTLEPGNVYNLRYRVMAYDGEMTPERAERLWTDFVYPPVVTVK